MPNRFENRRSLLLAVLLALLAAGTLCVWGAAAAGLSFSSPALEAAIQAFNETRARDTEVNGSPGGDVNIALPPDGAGDTGGDTGEGDTAGDDSDDTGAGDTNGNGQDDADTRNCLLGILCLELDADINAGGNAGAGAANNLGGLNIGGLHINANAKANDGLAAAVQVDVNAEGQDSARCFLNLICLTANAGANLAANDGLNADLNAVVNADVDLDDDIDADVDVNATVAGNAGSGNQSLLDSLLSVFINVD